MFKFDEKKNLAKFHKNNWLLKPISYLYQYLDLLIKDEQYLYFDFQQQLSIKFYK